KFLSSATLPSAAKQEKHLKFLSSATLPSAAKQEKHLKFLSSGILTRGIKTCLFTKCPVFINKNRQMES
ncbi:MAG: hypothetical protein WCY09_07540, partial [Candidatus Omnitrophota bacterium]